MRLIALLLIPFSAFSAAAGEFAANGCTAKWSDRTLTVGNALFSRAYVASNGVLRTASFRAEGGTEWQCDRVVAGAPLAVTAEKSKWTPVGVEGVRLTVVADGKTTVLDLYPGMPGLIASRKEVVAVEPRHDLDRDFDRHREWIRSLNEAVRRSDSFVYGSRHVKVTSMICADQTDMRDNLLDVNERLLMSYDWIYSVGASLLDCRDVVTGEGMAFVRIAPMPLCRPGRPDDFIVNGSGERIALLANGYPLAELVYSGGDSGRQRALIAFQRCLRPYRPGRDGVLLSNTWGAGNGDSRICQDFLLKEIEAGAKMGVDVIQIDDGWQHGRTANSRKQANAGKKKVWNGYWAADPDFWTEDRERFPGGLDLLVRKAAEKGMRFGLWFGPDSSDEAANWQRDADCLLDYHKRLGIDYFKMDSMKLYSTLAQERSRRMFNRMLELSGGAMVFDLDCTAEIRPGFLGLMDIGPVFVENRYSRRRVYWPHHTLKNLWDLSHVIDPVRMRLEFNNPDSNHEVYGNDPLSHARYRPDALFAIVMAASPLAWMELSDVSEKSLAAIAPLVSRWKAERERWHGGVLHPVAGRPDGVAWTGFVSETADGRGGYALLFRELNGKSRYTLDLEPVFGLRKPTEVEVIGGRGTATADGSLLSVEVPEKLDYIWVRFSVAGHPSA